LKLKELIHAIQLYLEELLANSFQIVWTYAITHKSHHIFLLLNFGLSQL
jgi:hypothetical protein